MTETMDRYGVWHPVTQMGVEGIPPKVSSAQGIYLTLDSGKQVMDAISSWWVNLHGHCHPAIVRAIAEQAATLEHVLLGGLTHDPAIRLAGILADVLPGTLSRTFFSDSGSAAVEIALKIALQYWSNQGCGARKRFFCFEGGYHGDTLVRCRWQLHLCSMLLGGRCVLSQRCSHSQRIMR